MSIVRCLLVPGFLAIVLAAGPARGEDAAAPAAGKDAEFLSAGSQQLLKALGNWTKGIPPLVREGDELARKGDYKGAVDSYTLGLHVEESSDTRYRRAYCHALLRKYDLAIEDCTSNLAKDPKDYKSQAMRAWCQVFAGRLNEATRDYEALVAAEPQDSRHAYALGTLQVRVNEFGKASEWFARAVQSDPREPNAYLARGQCLLLLKQPDQAVEQITALLKRIPRQSGGYARAPAFSRELSEEDLQHGRRQVETMLKDRPEMAAGLAPDDPLYKWAVRKFAGEDIPERIVWSSSLPEGAEANHGAPVGGEPGTVRIAERTRGFLGLLPGRKATFDVLWSRVCYELHNIQGTPDFALANQLARRSEISREGYIRQCAYHEYQALLRTRAFYVDVYFPWARAKKIETSPEQWRLLIASTFDGWLGQYDNRASYPWEPYGSYYDAMAGQRDLGQELEAQGSEPKLDPKTP